jgi:TRAP-type C4-dicarboxylate transport system permease small subunit
LDPLKRFDEGIARGEAALATAFLISMILAGAAQALCRFGATRLGLDAANAALTSLDWVDPLLQKGTMWLAFLGASLATRENRHIAIDIVPRLMPHQPKLIMKGLVGIASSGVAFVLSIAFWSQVRRIAEEGMAYTIFNASGAVHVCDASTADLEAAGSSASPLFCGLRSIFEALGISLQNPQAALQLVIPVMFIVIAVRLFANGVGAFLALAKPPREGDVEHLGGHAAPGKEG